MPDSVFANLEPQIVWKHFQTLCQIPRPSKHEQQIRDYLLAWAAGLGLSSYVDTIGNVIISKPATADMQHRVGVILQAHLDMVTQANRETVHDFFKDAIQPVIKEGWLIAENTTLGADNGIGVALAMAVLESNDLSHGPLEVLFTIDEEAGMSGARYLQAGVLKGQLLFNIDTEEWGELYLGCAASIDLEIEQAVSAVAIPEAYVYFDISVLGLQGGHSGVDIHLNRGNANVILVNFLHQVLASVEGLLLHFSGGTARNAIAREATARIAIHPLQVNNLYQELDHWQYHYRDLLQQSDANVRFEIEPYHGAVQQALAIAEQQRWLTALVNCPYGVAAMSKELDGVVQTSNNIGVLQLDPQQAKLSIMVRSIVNAEAQDFAESIQQHFSAYAIEAKLTALVSGWTPNPNSAALSCLQEAYQQAFKLEPSLKVIHAGLECGIIAEHYPQLEMVSFGPDIQGAHAPGERVRINSVANCWHLLRTALQVVGTQSKLQS